jgi:hypothetical protein
MLQYRIVVKRDDLTPLLLKLDQHVDNALKEYTEGKLLPQAQRNQAPHIDTGALNESGEVFQQGLMSYLLKFTGGAATGWTGEPRVYAMYHEYGTRFTGAYPFLGPAVDSTFPGDILDVIIQIFL